MINTQGKVYKNFINGEWVKASTSDSYKVFHPAANDEEIGRFPLSGVEDVKKAIKSAHAAFQTWRKVTASQRAEYIYRFIDLLESNKARLAEALCQEQGKPLKEAIDELEHYIIEKVRQLKLGNGKDKNTQIGPVIGQDALETILCYVNSAVNEGATIAIGGKRLEGVTYVKGYYFEPTVITNVTCEMRVAKEEIFGPVLVCIRAKSIEEAVSVSNNTEYGLAASIFTDKMDFSYDFAQDVESGMIHVNNGTVSEGHMPFGGVKNSGLGPYSIGGTNKDFYTNLKVIYTQYKDN